MERLPGKEKGHPDALIIEQEIKGNLIKIKKVINKKKVDDLRLFGLHHGEAEAVALYFQENAQFFATDDDTCRRNRIMLGINIIGSPAIVIMLFRKERISREKAIDCVSVLETIGWFISISKAAEDTGLTIGEIEEYMVREGFRSKYSVADLKRELEILE